MFRQPSILLLVFFKVFLAPFFQSCIHIERFLLVSEIIAIKHKEVGIMLNKLRIYGIERTAAERQVINGIEHIGLSRPIMPYKAVELG